MTDVVLEKVSGATVHRVRRDDRPRAGQCPDRRSAPEQTLAVAADQAAPAAAVAPPVRRDIARERTQYPAIFGRVPNPDGVVPWTLPASCYVCGRVVRMCTGMIYPLGEGAEASLCGRCAADIQRHGVELICPALANDMEGIG